jgi:hypothetical protein
VAGEVAAAAGEVAAAAGEVVVVPGATNERNESPDQCT